MVNIKYVLTPFIFLASVTHANQSYTFHYNDASQLKITVEAETRCAAYKKSAKICYNLLTGGTYDKSGKYPGEEQGLDIIDICANPTNYKL